MTDAVGWSPLRWAVIAIGLAIAWSMVGCEQGPSAACAATEVRLDATVTDEGMTPSALEACRGQAVTLVLASQTDGTFHVHGYETHIPATTLSRGGTASLTFTAEAAGQFIVELHHEGGEETEIGVFTVLEP